jgi:hypothetical protein
LFFHDYKKIYWQMVLLEKDWWESGERTDQGRHGAGGKSNLTLRGKNNFTTTVWKHGELEEAQQACLADPGLVKYHVDNTQSERDLVRRYQVFASLEYLVDYRWKDLIEFTYTESLEW